VIKIKETSLSNLGTKKLLPTRRDLDVVISYISPHVKLLKQEPRRMKSGELWSVRTQL